MTYLSSRTLGIFLIPILHRDLTIITGIRVNDASDCARFLGRCETPLAASCVPEVGDRPLTLRPRKTPPYLTSAIFPATSTPAQRCQWDRTHKRGHIRPTLLSEEVKVGFAAVPHIYDRSLDISADRVPVERSNLISKDGIGVASDDIFLKLGFEWRVGEECDGRGDGVRHKGVVLQRRQHIRSRPPPQKR